MQQPKPVTKYPERTGCNLAENKSRRFLKRFAGAQVSCKKEKRPMAAFNS
jgi:hypothetical protein